VTAFAPLLGGLLTPALFWAGLGLATIPIIIHLLSRRRVRRVRWAAMQWLLAAMKRHQRRLRLENWLILFLRMAAIALLGLALARPVLTDSPLAGLVASQRSVYLVLDNSYSTEAKLDARSVFETVKYEADVVLRSLGPDDAVAVIVTNDPDVDATDGLAPHVLVGRSLGSEGATRSREAVAALKTRHAPADWVRTLQKLEEQMADDVVNRHVVVVTDLQAKDWLRPPRERIPDGGATGTTPPPRAEPAPSTDRLQSSLVSILRRPAAVRVVNVGARDRRDLVVAAIENRTEQDPFVGRPLRLAVTVANYGGEPVVGAGLEVTVDGTDRKYTQLVPDMPAANTGLRVPQPATEVVQVDLPKGVFRAPGSHTLRVAVTPPREDAAADTLGLSSERWLSLRVRRRVNVVAWAQTSRSEQNVEAVQYLQGIYQGDTGGDGGSPLLRGPEPIYEFRSAHSEASLLAMLRGRTRNPVDLVVLANVVPRDERMIDALRAFVREGGGLLVFTGDRVGDPEALNAAFHTPEAAGRLMPFPLGPPELRKRSDERQGAFAFDLSFQEDPHPLAEPFTNVRADDWIKRFPPAIWGRTAFRPPAPAAEGSDGSGEGPGRGADDARVVLHFEAEAGETPRPAVVTSRFGEGRTVWVGTSIDNGWLATAVLFLPVFLDEAAMYLTRPADAGRNLEVGGLLRASVPAEAEKVRLTRPGGGPISPARRAPEGDRAVRVLYSHAELGRAGVWRLTYQMPSVSGEPQRVEEQFAVNPDPREGSLFSADEQALRDGVPAELDMRFLQSYAEEGTELREAREGEISRFILWALLGVLLLESLLALRFGRRSAVTEGAAPGAPGS
jgi:hypothetical protein